MNTPEYVNELYLIGKIGPNQKYSVHSKEILDNESYSGWLYTIYHRTSSGENRNTMYQHLTFLLNSVRNDYNNQTNIPILQSIENGVKEAIKGIKNLTHTVYYNSTEFSDILVEYLKMEQDLNNKINLQKSIKEIDARESSFQKTLDFIFNSPQNSPPVPTRSTDLPEKTVVLDDNTKINIRKNAFAILPPPGLIE